MTKFADSYVSRVLFAIPAPGRGVDLVARRWRWLSSVSDPYRPELYYIAWSRAEMAREAYALCQSLKMAHLVWLHQASTKTRH